MKKILFAILIAFCSIYRISAQNLDCIEFMGLSLCDNDTTAFCTLLKDKGYKSIGKTDDIIMYKGVFANLSAEAAIVPFKGSDRVNAVFISLNDLNPMKLGTLYTELLTKFMQKYEDYKYDTQIDSGGTTTTSFRNNVGFVALQSKVSGMGKCQLSIYYSCSNPSMDGNSQNKGGISADDL